MIRAPGDRATLAGSYRDHLRARSAASGPSGWPWRAAPALVALTFARGLCLEVSLPVIGTLPALGAYRLERQPSALSDPWGHRRIP